jgi:hypothetical protein
MSQRTLRIDVIKDRKLLKRIFAHHLDACRSSTLIYYYNKDHELKTYRLYDKLVSWYAVAGLIVLNYPEDLTLEILPIYGRR